MIMQVCKRGHVLEWKAGDSGVDWEWADLDLDVPVVIASHAALHEQEENERTARAVALLCGEVVRW